jgi:hypothetical protein
MMFFNRTFLSFNFQNHHLNWAMLLVLRRLVAIKFLSNVGLNFLRLFTVISDLVTASRLAMELYTV